MSLSKPTALPVKVFGSPRSQCVAALLFVCFFHAAAGFAGEMVVYLRPGGNDHASGLTQSTGVASLQIAIDHALSQSGPGHDRLRISVAPGHYIGQRVVTGGSPEGKPLLIGAEKGATERPRFDGGGMGGTWLILRNGSGKPTRLTIDGLEIANYVTAISLNGNRTDPGDSNSENAIRNNVFRNIGQIAHPAGKRSTAAVRLVNSDNNTIVQNRFENIRNITGCGALHSIYIAHYSTGNQITDNVFDGGCGATIKVRDASDRTTVRRNRFVAQDTKATFLDSYCNQDIRSDCTKREAECPSWGNVYEDNLVEKKNASRDLRPVRITMSKAPAGCPEPASNMPRVKETGTRIVP